MVAAITSAVGPSSEGVVPWQLGHSTSDRFVDRRLNGALILVQAVGETGAVIHARGTRVASVDDVLEEGLVPAGHEVGVQAVTGSVTVGKDKGLLSFALLPAASERGRIPIGFEEQVGDVDPALGAVHLAVVVLGPGHVVLVVGQASLGVVAGGEVNVGTERRGIAVAVDIGEAHAFAFVVGILHTGLVAVGADGPAGVGFDVFTRACPLDAVDGAFGRVKVGLGAGGGRRTGSGIAGKHLQAQGKGLDLIVGGLEKVVNVGVEELDGLEVAGLGVLEVKRGEPVVGVVALDHGRAAFGFFEILASRAKTEAASAKNVVNVRRRLAGSDDGVSTGNGELLVGEAQDSKSPLVLGGRGDAEKGRQGGGGGEFHGC